MIRFLILCLILLSPAASWAAGAAFNLLEGPEREGDSFVLRISDRWINACTPQLESLEVRGADIWIIARDTSEGRFCGQAPTDYGLQTRLLPQTPRLQSRGVQRVHYVVRSRGGDRLRGFELMAMGEDLAPSAVLESGFWWADPEVLQAYAGRGIGLSLERQGDAVSGVMFGYGAGGAPEWTLSSGQAGAHFLRMDLNRLADGGGPLEPYREPRQLQPLGSMLIEPASPSRARLWLVYADALTGDLSLRQIEIVRFGFSGSPSEAWLGEWLLVPPGSPSGETAARRIRFVTVGMERDGFALRDVDGAASLECSGRLSSSDAIPELCRLRVGAGAGAQQYVLESIGLRRMAGSDAQGRTVLLISLESD